MIARSSIRPCPHTSTFPSLKDIRTVSRWAVGRSKMVTRAGPILGFDWQRMLVGLVIPARFGPEGLNVVPFLQGRNGSVESMWWRSMKDWWARRRGRSDDEDLSFMIPITPRLTPAQQGLLETFQTNCGCYCHKHPTGLNPCDGCQGRKRPCVADPNDMAFG